MRLVALATLAALTAACTAPPPAVGPIWTGTVPPHVDRPEPPAGPTRDDANRRHPTTRPNAEPDGGTGGNRR